jgi:hypothetical protein
VQTPAYVCGVCTRSSYIQNLEERGLNGADTSARHCPHVSYYLWARTARRRARVPPSAEATIHTTREPAAGPRAAGYDGLAGEHRLALACERVWRQQVTAPLPACVTTEEISRYASNKQTQHTLRAATLLHLAKLQKKRHRWVSSIQCMPWWVVTAFSCSGGVMNKRSGSPLLLLLSLAVSLFGE